VQHIENHDEHWRQRTGGPLPRVPRLADGNDARSWWARSRSRVAAGILMTAPGIPMLFMGQEFLEDKPWTDDGQNHPGCGIYWDGLGRDRAMDDYLRFMQELIALRKRLPALRSESIHPYYVHNDNRVLAYHRWIEGQGDDVVIVASLRETTYGNYRLGLPQAGRWNEVFNSDVYDNFVNPRLAGNGGSIWAENEPRDGFAASAEIVIPANSVLIFARQ
jgi:1,4-alpha-glucan branching enzyme